MMTKDVFFDVGGFNETYVCGDYDMWLRILEKHDAYFLREYLTYYRFHGTQTSLKRSMWEDSYRVVEAAIARHNYPASVVRKRYAVLHYRLMQHSLKEKKAEWILHAIKSAMLDPKRAFSLVADTLKKKLAKLKS